MSAANMTEPITVVKKEDLYTINEEAYGEDQES